jgi:hypothetical protein
MMINQLVPLKERVVECENHTKHKDIFCGQNWKFKHVTAFGTYWTNELENVFHFQIGKEERMCSEMNNRKCFSNVNFS